MVPKGRKNGTEKQVFGAFQGKSTSFHPFIHSNFTNGYIS
jgi:hypothetical protein